MASELRVDKIHNEGGDNDSGLDMSTNDVVAVKIAGSEKARVDASGNVGIGNTTPSSFYSLADNLVVGTGTGGHGITIYSGNDSSGYIGFNDTASNGMQGFIQYNHDGNYIAIGPNGSERMRFGSSGEVEGTCLHAAFAEYDGDMDDLKKTGFYRSKNSNSNNPSTAYYSVIVFGNQGNVTAQIATQLQSTTTYVRAYNSAWSSWGRLDT